MAIATAPFSSSDVPDNYFDGQKNVTRGILPSLASFLRDAFSRITAAEHRISAGTVLPGNNEGYEKGAVFTLTGGAVRSLVQFINTGTDAAVSWVAVASSWQVAGNPNVLGTTGYAGDRVYDTVGAVNYQQRTSPSGTTWDVI